MSQYHQYIKIWINLTRCRGSGILWLRQRYAQRWIIKITFVTIDTQDRDIFSFYYIHSLHCLVVFFGIVFHFLLVVWIELLFFFVVSSEVRLYSCIYLWYDHIEIIKITCYVCVFGDFMAKKYGFMLAQWRLRLFSWTGEFGRR